MWNVFVYVLLFFYKCGRRLAELLRRPDSVRVFMVLADGAQVPMNPSVRPHALVVKHVTNGGARYRFVEQPKPTHGYASDALVVPKNKMLGLAVDVGERTYPLNVDEFNVGASTLFTPLFNRWLCRNYLGIAVSEEVEATVIDADVNVTCSKEPLYLK